MTAQDPVSPGRSISLKLGETGDSIMMFEETVRLPGKELFPPASRQRRGGVCPERRGPFKIGDEVTVGGPGSAAFMPRVVPHAWKSTGAQTGRVLFLYTPAKAGGLIEEQQRTGRKFGSMNGRKLAEMLQRHGWELLGPSPL